MGCVRLHWFEGQKEKMVREQIFHPFIATMLRTFKDEYFIYFLSEYINGQELFDVIREVGYLSSPHAAFYVSSLVLAMEYLHSKNIVYRDVKPENIIIEADGYIKLIDIGSAKILMERNSSYKTFTVVGTPHYMAPEIFERKGYSFSVDLWSIGICLFEFMVGYLPFGDNADDPFEVYKAILGSKLDFPGYFEKNEQKAKNLIEQLLNRAPEARLGGSYATLKAHPWFFEIDWVDICFRALLTHFLLFFSLKQDAILDREVQAPFIPLKKVDLEKKIKAADAIKKSVVKKDYAV